MRENDEKMQRSNNPKKLKLATFTGAAGLLLGLALTSKNPRRKVFLSAILFVLTYLRRRLTIWLTRLSPIPIRVHDAVALVPLNKLSYENVVLPLAELEARKLALIQCCVIPKMLSPHDNVRKASAEAELKIDSHLLSCRKREDVYRVIKIYAAKGESIAPEAKPYLQCLVRDFEHNGLNLTATKREEVDRLRNEIDELSLRYVQNLDEDSSCLFFTEAELAGLPLEFLQSLDKTQNKEFKLTLESNHVAAILELCKIANTRKTGCGIWKEMWRCQYSAVTKIGTCMSILETPPQKPAADFNYALDQRMSKTSTTDISSNLTDLASRELSFLKDLKRKEEGELPFGVEDLLYYIRKVEELQVDLDFGDIRQYFPVSLVLPGIFKICQDLFGEFGLAGQFLYAKLKIEEVTEIDVWYYDVRAFTVFDSGSGKLLGYFYLDMFSREGKFSQSCVVTLQNNALFSNGACQIPVALLIAQFAKDKLCLWGSLKSNISAIVLHLLRADPDFREIPSQLLENWCYESFTLKLISGYRQDITKPLVDEVCKTLKRWRYSFSALKSLQEILYCLFDQKIYSDDDVDFHQLIRSLHPKVMLGLPVVEGTNPASCFPRAVIGSEATCYSRLWSEVYAADIFTSQFGDGHPNLYNGLQFRDKEAEKPWNFSPVFLEGEPSTQAYIESRSKYSLRYLCAPNIRGCLSESISEAQHFFNAVGDIVY